MALLKTGGFESLSLLLGIVLSIAFLITLCSKGKKEADEVVKKGKKKKKGKGKRKKNKKPARDVKSALIKSNYAYGRDDSSDEDDEEEDDKTEIIDPATGLRVKTPVGRVQVTNTERGGLSDKSRQSSRAEVDNNDRKSLGKRRDLGKPPPKPVPINLPRAVSEPNLVKEKMQPNKSKMGAKEKRIREGEIRGKTDYPTMDDVVSEWDEDNKNAGKDKQPVAAHKDGPEDVVIKADKAVKVDGKIHPEPFTAKSTKEVGKSAKQLNPNENLEFTAKGD